MMKSTLSILLVALGVNSASAKLGSGIRDLVVADWRMSCGACGKLVTDELTCNLSDGTDSYIVQCSGCPDCPAPLNEFACDVSAASYTTDTAFEVVLVDGSSAYCKVSSADFNTAYCEKACPVTPEYKIYCGACTVGSPVTCQAVQGNGGVVNDLSCMCPDPAVCPSTITCTDQATPPRAVPDANYPIFFDNTNYGTCKQDPRDATGITALCAGNAEFCPPAEVVCGVCSGNIKTCTVDGVATFTCSCSNCIDDVCNTSGIVFTNYPSGIKFPADCTLSTTTTQRDTLTCPGECTTTTTTTTTTVAPPTTTVAPPTTTAAPPTTTAAPPTTTTTTTTQCVQTCGDSDGVCCDPRKPKCEAKRNNNGYSCKA